MRVADLMTKSVIAARENMSLAEAIHLMAGHGLSGLPVLDDKDGLVGIITEGDLLRRAEIGADPKPGWLTSFFLPGSSAERYTRAHSRHVSDVMTRSVQTVAEDTPVQDAAAIMETRHIRRLPVVRDGRIVGILARADLLSGIAEVLAEHKSSPASDSDIRNAVLRAFRTNGWVPRATVGVDVANGVVRLSGTISDERLRAGLCTLAESTPGTKGVRDQMVCIEPISGVVLGAMD